MATHTEADLETRLRLAHQSRRAAEHQLDGIRRALCDAGFMQDDDPYGHADLADVIRQVGEAGAEPVAGICPAVSDRTGLNRDQIYGCIRDADHESTWHEDQGGAKWRQIVQPAPAEPACPDLPGHGTHSPPCGFFQRPEAAALTRPVLVPCSVNHDCPSQPRLEPLTARGEARCQSQHRAKGGALVQCALAVHPGNSHTDYDPGQTPPAGRNPELPWLTWRDKGEEADGSMAAGMPDGRPVAILYVNHRGQRADRQVLPQRLWFGTTEWHTELQWFLDATDLDRGVQRSFALRDILAFDMRPGPLA